MLCLRSADTIEGREISTAWSIIWSNGGPSVRNKSPPLFCISSSDDWPTFVPRRWSQLKAPSVKRLRLPDAEPQWGKHIHTHTRSLTNLLSYFFPIFILFLFHILHLSFSFPPFLSFLSLSLPARPPKSNFILSVLSRSVYTISHCLVSSVISKFSIYTEYIGNIQRVLYLICTS